MCGDLMAGAPGGGHTTPRDRDPGGRGSTGGADGCGGREGRWLSGPKVVISCSRSLGPAPTSPAPCPSADRQPVRDQVSRLTQGIPTPQGEIFRKKAQTIEGVFALGGTFNHTFNKPESGARRPGGSHVPCLVAADGRGDQGEPVVNQQTPAAHRGHSASPFRVGVWPYFSGSGSPGSAAEESYRSRAPRTSHIPSPAPSKLSPQHSLLLAA